METIKPVLYSLSGNDYMVSADNIPEKYIKLYHEEDNDNFIPIITFNAKDFVCYVNGGQSHYIKAAAELMQHFEVHHANISRMVKLSAEKNKIEFLQERANCLDEVRNVIMESDYNNKVTQNVYAVLKQYLIVP